MYTKTESLTDPLRNQSLLGCVFYFYFILLYVLTMFSTHPPPQDFTFAAGAFLFLSFVIIFLPLISRPSSVLFLLCVFRKLRPLLYIIHWMGLRYHPNKLLFSPSYPLLFFLFFSFPFNCLLFDFSCAFDLSEHFGLSLMCILG